MGFGKHVVKHREKGAFGLSASRRGDDNRIGSFNQFRDCPKLNLGEVIKAPLFQSCLQFRMQGFSQFFNRVHRTSSGSGRSSVNGATYVPSRRNTSPVSGLIAFAIGEILFPGIIRTSMPPASS